MTPLHTAAWKGHEEVVRLLLEAGCDKDNPNINGITPLHEATWKGHERVVHLLLEERR
jgi:ankyrin repeat protein